nr:immunoglobulin heavy chain junction region [Mus musculus]
CARSLTTDDYW